MTIQSEPISPSRTVAEIAATRPGASRVFHRFGLDFCCGGHVPLGTACAGARVDLDQVLAELENEAARTECSEDWNSRPLDALIDHLVDHYHADHRVELPRLIEMARKVEEVHAGNPSRPQGLADLLTRQMYELEAHMQKEEQVAFPLIREAQARRAAVPIQVLEEEHRDQGEYLQRLRAKTKSFTPPSEACGTWRALYTELAALERDLMEHIHLENNILFPRALRG